MTRLLLSAVLSLALTAGALAHEPRIGPNGGAMVDAGDLHAELMASGKPEVIVHLYDINDKPIAATGFKANAILVIDGKPLRFPLVAGEGSQLLGTSPVAVPAGVKGAIQITGPDGATSQAKY